MVERIERAWWRRVGWWPLGAVDSAALALGALFIAQALNTMWERRGVVRRLSLDERIAVGLLTGFCVLIVRGGGFLGSPGVALVGISAHWYVEELVRLVDEGFICAKISDEDSADDEGD